MAPTHGPDPVNSPRRSHARHGWLLILCLGLPSCMSGGEAADPAESSPDPTTSSGSAGESTALPPPAEGSTDSGGPGLHSETGAPDSTGTDEPTAGSESTDTGQPADPGPMVDASDPQLYAFEFSPQDADPEASLHLDTQLAYLDTRVSSRGQLVVFLHGAGSPSTCGRPEHGQMLAGLGFHVVSPCYVADYGVGNCGDDVGGCRLEAFEGVDHSPVIDIDPPDSTEYRVARALEYLQEQHPGGDWQYYLDGEIPRWDRMIITGGSHGGSSSGVAGMHRLVHRVVMLSGPLDSGQAWLSGVPLTPIDRFYGFTHTGDGQHEGHLAAFEALGLPGAPTVVDGAMPPYGGSHRLVTSAPTGNGHGSTSANNSSPQQDGEWVFLPVWETMYLD